MAGENISEHRATSDRNAGRHHRGFASDFPRNPLEEAARTNHRTCLALEQVNPPTAALQGGFVTKLSRYEKLDGGVIFSDYGLTKKTERGTFATDGSALGRLGDDMIDGGVMPKVTYIEHDGTRHRVEVPVGLSLMRGAIDNNVPGIDADCGGQCACATCHVYVEPAWFDKIGGPSIGSQEESMLSFAAAAELNSRLACQIAMREEFDGLTVRMPQGQH